jgi:hypothetical protein
VSFDYRVYIHLKKLPIGKAEGYYCLLFVFYVSCKTLSPSLPCLLLNFVDFFVLKCFHSFLLLCMANTGVFFVAIMGLT